MGTHQGCIKTTLHIFYSFIQLYHGLVGLGYWITEHWFDNYKVHATVQEIRW